MRWPAALPIGIVLTLLLTGCRSNCDLVEAELRAREQELHVLRDKLQQSHFYRQALEYELHTLRDPSCPGGVSAYPGPVFPVREVVLGRGTAGHPSDHHPGDDALLVHLEPRDPEGQAIKVPGSLLVEAVQIDERGLKTPLSSWEVLPDRLRLSWRTGLFTTGYRLTLPWKTWPSTEKLRVTARFRAYDGRLFEADKDITIHLAPECYRKSPGSEPGTPGPAGPVEGAPPLLPDWTPPPPQNLAPREVSPPLDFEPLPTPRPIAPDPTLPAPTGPSMVPVLPETVPESETAPPLAPAPFSGTLTRRVGITPQEVTRTVWRAVKPWQVSHPGSAGE
jgi:hypothetical protein